MEQNSRVVLVFHLRLSGLGESGKEKDLPNFAEKVSKFPTLGTRTVSTNQAVGGLLLLST